MEEVAHFCKIDLEEFEKFFNKYSSYFSSKTLWSKKEILDIYNKIQIPIKEGPYYLFKNIKDFSLKPNEKIVIPLGIKAEIINEDFILTIGKYNSENEPIKNYILTCWNNVPFYSSGQEMQICAYIENLTNSTIYFSEGMNIAYGIFTKVGCTF